MSRVAVVIPFKGAGHKSRLAEVLGDGDRARLSLLMLQDVLEAFDEAGLASSCCLVSSDDNAIKLAADHGAVALREAADRGVNAAVQTGIAGTDASEFLVVPADVPLLQRADIDRVLGFKSVGIDVVVSPSARLDGTNLLYMSREKMLTLSYDEDSFRNHVADAARRAFSLAVYTGKGVIFDVDTVEDMETLARSEMVRRSVAFAREVLR